MIHWWGELPPGSHCTHNYTRGSCSERSQRQFTVVASEVSIGWVLFILVKYILLKKCWKTQLSWWKAQDLCWHRIFKRSSFVKKDILSKCIWWKTTDFCFREMSLFKETSAQRFRRESAEMWVWNQISFVSTLLRVKLERMQKKFQEFCLRWEQMEKGLNSVARIPSHHLSAPIKLVD